MLQSGVFRSLSLKSCHSVASNRELFPTMQDIPVNTESSKKLRIVSGVQPTGYLHIGNYLGAIRQWLVNQDEYENLFFVVDLHAITVQQETKTFSDATLAAAAIYLACGIDPSKSAIFVQSHVRAHVELCWLLNCVTPVNWLERMIQFKEKTRKQGGENVSIGLFDYPILMAADILLYESDLVPVGEDQRQHLELGDEKLFKEPRALIQPMAARIMSLDDGTSKMSKSSPNDMSRINLLDSASIIQRKIRRCKTDSYMGITIDPENRPECTNLLNIYAALTQQSLEKVAEECQHMSWGQFKKFLTEAVVDSLEPIQRRYHELRKEEDYLKQVLREGREFASNIAERTVRNVKERMGFLIAE
eukprot:jgi/Galph1/4694/GphlegSOOS_G3350.1